MAYIVVIVISILVVCLYQRFIKNHNITQSSKKNQNNYIYENKRLAQNHKCMKWHDIKLNISMIPKSIELDSETLLPQIINRKYAYGKRFNVFTIDDDTVFYHRSTCVKVRGKSKYVSHRYLIAKKMKACPICQPLNYIDEWYIRFINDNFKNFSSEDKAYSRENSVKPANFCITPSEQISLFDNNQLSFLDKDNKK